MVYGVLLPHTIVKSDHLVDQNNYIFTLCHYWSLTSTRRSSAVSTGKLCSNKVEGSNDLTISEDILLRSCYTLRQYKNSWTHVLITMVCSCFETSCFRSNNPRDVILLYDGRFTCWYLAVILMLCSFLYII